MPRPPIEQVPLAHAASATDTQSSEASTLRRSYGVAHRTAKEMPRCLGGNHAELQQALTYAFAIGGMARLGLAKPPAVAVGLMVTQSLANRDSPMDLGCWCIATPGEGAL